jgi:DNA-directed RNA polymerase subunit RPC12/RpoP
LPGKTDKTRKSEVCIDCGKQFQPIVRIDKNKEHDEFSSVVVCERCSALLKRRFWNSMKMEMKKKTSSNVSFQEGKIKE